MCRKRVPASLSRLLLVTPLCWALLCCAGASGMQAGVDRALVIGLNYQEAPNHIPRLRYAVPDAKEVAELARDVMGVQEVVLLVDGPEGGLLTATAMKQRIESFLREARGGQAVLVFFAGHGTEEEGKSYVVAGDGEKVAISDIRSSLEACRAEYKVVIVDACHSGGRALFRSGFGADFFREISPWGTPSVPNMATISACDVGEVAYEAEIGGKGNGVFTHYFVKGLRDGAAAIDNQREVFLGGLYSYLAKAVAEWGDHRQHPRLIANFRDIQLVQCASPPAGTPTERDVPFATFPVYLDKGSSYNHFYPSGWMGDWGDITLDDNWTEGQYSGSTCIKITYSAARTQGKGWAGVYWQDPDSNWGDKIGGFDLTGARRLTFVAKGKTGREVAEFKFGGIAGAVSSDSVRPPVTTGAVTLSTSWRRYAIDLSGRDLTRVIGGFCWVAEAAQNPGGCTVYLDDIQIEGEFRQRDLATQRIDLGLPTWQAPPEPNARGYILLSRESEAFRGRLALTGLTPGKAYLLTLNGKVGRPGNEQLKGVQQHVTPEGEGYVDIAQVVADENGNVSHDLEFALPPGQYEVKFFVKETRKWTVVLYNDFVRFIIR